MRTDLAALRTNRGFILALGGSIFIGPASLAIFMPAVPAIREEFNIALQSAQLSLTLPLIATLLTPLVVGRLVDQIGRRGVLLICQALMIVGCLMCIYTDSYTVLVAGRILVGVFSSACMIIGRAVVGDVYKGPDLARVAARFTVPPVLGIMLAPIAGGFIIEYWTWRETFWFVLVITAVLGVCTWRILPETREVVDQSDNDPLNIRLVLGSRRLWGYFGQSSCHFAVAFAFASIAPHVMVSELGNSVTVYAFGLLFVLAGLLAGIVTAERVETSRPLHQLVFRTTVAGSLASVCCVCVLLFLGIELSAASLFTPAVIVAYFIGLTMPYSQAGIISTIENQAGTASGISTALQMLAAAALTHVFAVQWLEPHLSIALISAVVMFMALVFVAGAARE